MTLTGGSHLPSSAQRCLRLLTLIVDAAPIDEDSEQPTGARLLLSLSTVDVLSWICYKVVWLEAVLSARLAYALDPQGFRLSAVGFVTLLSTVELTCELGASAATPHLHAALLGRSTLDVGAMAIFALCMYGIALVAAVLLALGVTPCMWNGSLAGGNHGDQYVRVLCDADSCACASDGDGAGFECTANATASWEVGHRNSCCMLNGTQQNVCVGTMTFSLPWHCPLSPAALAYAHAAMYWLFYATVNQFGDAVMVIAQTQWLPAFTGLELRFPGVMRPPCAKFGSGRTRPRHRLVQPLPNRASAEAAKTDTSGGCGKRIAQALLVRRPASALALSTYLIFLRLLLYSIGGVAYYALKGSGLLRWLLLLVVSTVGAIGCAILLCHCRRSVSKAALLAGLGVRLGEASAPHCRTGNALASVACSTSQSECSTSQSDAPHQNREKPQRSPAGNPSQVSDAQPRSTGGSVAILRSKSDSLRLSEGRRLLRPSALRLVELSFIGFYVIVRAVPTQAQDNVVAFLSGEAIEAFALRVVGDNAAAEMAVQLVITSLAALIGLVTILYMLRKIRQLPKPSAMPTVTGVVREHQGTSDCSSASGDAQGQPVLASRPQQATRRDSHATPAAPASSSFKRWLWLLWAMIFSLFFSGSLASLPALIPSLSDEMQLVLTVIAILLFVPYLPLSKSLDILIDAFLLLYSPARSPSLVYYAQIAQVLVSWLLLGVKIAALEGLRSVADFSACETTADVDSERYELGQMILLTSIIMLMGGLYFSVIDPRLTASSMWKLLRAPRLADGYVG